MRLWLLLFLSVWVLPLPAKHLQEQVFQKQEGPFSWKGLVNWEEESIQVRGMGAPPRGLPPAQWRPMAIRAAKVVGLRDLGEVVYGVRVTSETTVKKAVLQNDAVKTKMEAFLQGFSTSDPKYLSDGTIEVVVSLPLYGAKGLSKILFPPLFQTPPPPSGEGVKERLRRLEEKMRDLQRELEELKREILKEGRIFFFPFLSRYAAAENYTGLIVLGKQPDPGIKPAMAPKILSASNVEVYGTVSVDPEVAIDKGIVSYAPSLEAAEKLPRVGEHPLVISAISFHGPFQADPVISDRDAEQIASSNLPTLFKKCPVAVVTN